MNKRWFGFPSLLFLSFPPPFSTFLLSSPFLGYTFEKYCKDIYGLTEEEIKYVWKQYKDIIKDKIKL